MYVVADLDECKKLMVETLKFIDDVCKKNNIEYCLEFGTLLGAYRHKGFIPWDDDVDIAMTRENYNKFIEYMKKNSNPYFYLLHKDTKEGYPFEFAKIMMKDTVVVIDDDGANMIMDRGIFIDIFTLDFYKENVSRKYRKFIRQIENARKESVIEAVNSKFYKIIFKAFRVVSKIFIPFNLVERAKKKYISEDGKYIGFAIEQTDEMICERKYYLPLKEIEFEGYMFPCPNNVEHILECEYGNSYMELPPEEKRVRHFEYGAMEEDVAKRYNIDITGRKKYSYEDIINKGGEHERFISNSTSL